MWEKELNIEGYDGLDLNIWITGKNKNSDHLAIVVPGYVKSVQYPPLHFCAEILLEIGADVLRVERNYSDTGLLDKTDQEQIKWIEEDAEKILLSGLAFGKYTKLTLIGLSIGTLQLGKMSRKIGQQKVSYIWLGPLLSNAELAKNISAHSSDSLIIMGENDKQLKDFGSSNFRENFAQAEIVTLKGIGHGLEKPGNVDVSLEALNKIIGAVKKFVSSQ